LSDEAVLRFWATVRRGQPGECWEWQALKSPSGYGRIRLDGKQHRAHRVAFFLANGRWPTPCCCHSCDNRACCNPAHLWEGTNSENTKDAVRKGRMAHGSRSPRANLNEWNAIGAMAMSLMGATRKTIAAQFGINPSGVYRILHRQMWHRLFSEVQEGN
jgi:hypothetical protein